MSTWDGWAHDFLGLDRTPRTADNLQFLEDWAAHADNPDCGNNPIDLSHRYPSSSACGPVGAYGRRSQRYPNHSFARSAFYAQLDSGNFPALAAAIKDGHPYKVKNWQDVAANIGDWGSGKFANVYLAATRPGHVEPVKAAHAHGGWRALQHSFNHNMPRALHRSNKLVKAGLRDVRRASKVHL